MRKLSRFLLVALSIIPALVVYDYLAQAIPFLPNLSTPVFFVPVSFVSIALIVLLGLWLRNK